MNQQKIKVYTYTRVSTAMQVDGYSLDAQKSRMKAYADFNSYEIVGQYEDAGKSGKSIEGRAAFTRMMDDIKSGKDQVSFVLVFKLSRFGRNAADVLSCHLRPLCKHLCWCERYLKIFGKSWYSKNPAAKRDNSPFQFALNPNDSEESRLLWQNRLWSPKDRKDSWNAQPISSCGTRQLSSG